MKILVIQTAFIGDVVLTTPLIRNLQNNFKDAEIHFVGVAAGCEILKDFPNIKTYVLKKTPKIAGILEMIQNFKQIEFDLILCVHRSMRSVLLASRIKAKRKIAFNTFWSKLFQYETVDYPNYSEEIHYAQKPLKLLENLNLESSAMKPALYTNNADKNWAQLQLETFTNKKYLVLSPFSVWGTKMWFSDRFAKTCIELSKTNHLAIVITGANQQKERVIASTIAEKIIQSGGEAINLVGQTTMGQLKAIIENANIVLSNDSAAVHIAASFNIPTVAIFGPTVKKWGFFPLSDKYTVIEKKDVACRPCSLHGPQKCPKVHFKCMNEIQVEEVVQAVRKYI